jgi:hypothetical protein
MQEKYSTRGSTPLLSTNSKEKHNKCKGKRKCPSIAEISAKYFSQWESYVIK